MVHRPVSFFFSLMDYHTNTRGFQPDMERGRAPPLQKEIPTSLGIGSHAGSARLLVASINRSTARASIYGKLYRVANRVTLPYVSCHRPPTMALPTHMVFRTYDHQFLLGFNPKLYLSALTMASVTIS